MCCWTNQVFSSLSYLSEEYSNEEYRQKESIRGKVSNASSEPIVGVNVVEKGIFNGTATDVTGEFSLEVEDVAKSYQTLLEKVEKLENKVNQ